MLGRRRHLRPDTPANQRPHELGRWHKGARIRSLPINIYHCGTHLGNAISYSHHQHSASHRSGHHNRYTIVNMANQRLDRPSENVLIQAHSDEILFSLATKAKGAEEENDDPHRFFAVAHSPSPTSDEDETERTPNYNDEAPQAAGAALENAKTEDTLEYPPPSQAALVMFALLLALFLSALVGQ